MKTIKLKRPEFIGTRCCIAGEIVEVHDDRAARIVQAGAGEYHAPEIEFATIPEPPKETMTVKRRRRKGE